MKNDIAVKHERQTADFFYEVCANEGPCSKM